MRVKRIMALGVALAAIGAACNSSNGADSAEGSGGNESGASGGRAGSSGGRASASGGSAGHSGIPSGGTAGQGPGPTGESGGDHQIDLGDYGGFGGVGGEGGGASAPSGDYGVVLRSGGQALVVDGAEADILAVSETSEWILTVEASGGSSNFYLRVVEDQPFASGKSYSCEFVGIALVMVTVDYKVYGSSPTGDCQLTIFEFGSNLGDRVSGTLTGVFVDVQNNDSLTIDSGAFVAQVRERPR